MNSLSLLNTFSYCILILHAYKDFLATLYPLYISFGVAFWLVVLGCCAITHSGPFLINLINGLLELNSESGPMCGLSGSRLVKIGFC